MNKVIHGDCLELMNTLEAGSVDLILTDLPYGTTQCSWDTIIDIEKLWECFYRVLKENGVIVLTSAQPFTTRLIASNYSRYSHIWVWLKNRPTGFFLAKRMPRRTTEDVVVFRTNAGNYTYNPQGIRKGSWRGGSVQGNRNSKEGSQIFKPKNATYRQEQTNYPTNIIKIDTDHNEFTLHPTQKPVQLFEYFIKTYSNEGETVLDCCAGSGTTALACIRTKRNYILMEKEGKFIDVINKRIEEENKLISLF